MKDVLKRIAKHLEKVSQDRDWIERQGLEVAGGSAESFASDLRQAEHKWRAIVERLGLAPR